MKHATITRVLLAAVVAAASACTMKNQEAPPLTGPSEFATAITITASPDILTQDGASQSLITITARDAKGAPARNVSLRSEIAVAGVRADFGTLSARNLVTDSNGRATLVYTAPIAGGIDVDHGTVVDILVTPVGTDYGNSTPRLVSIRLVPPGIIVPPDGLQPAFTFTPPGPSDHQNVLFDASTSQAPTNNPIASYAWDFGDGGRGSGRTATHSYNSAGSYFVKLTISDAIGRSASTTQTVVVGQGLAPSVAFTFSPTTPQVNQVVNFNASGTRPATGRTIQSYFWDFGDGTQKTTTGPTTTHDFVTAGSFQVTLTATDDAGHAGSLTVALSVGSPGAPTAAFTRSPAAPGDNEQVFFNATTSKPAAGRTIVSFAWDFGDGATGSGVTPTHVYTTAGSYTVTLTVTDDYGQVGTASVTVTVTSASAPTATFTFSPTDPVPTQAVNFNPSTSRAATGRTIVSYRWDFGDGSAIVTTTGPNIVSHPYATENTFTVTLTVTDDQGRTGTSSKTVAVKFPS